MLLKLNSKYRQRGIGLLELMLSLAIISLLLIMATRYYSTTKRSKEMTEAVSLIHAIRAGANNYATPGGYVPQGDVMTSLISAGLLPAYITAPATASPWGTSVVANTTGGKVLTITLTLPAASASDKTAMCSLLLAQVMQSGADPSSTCTDPNAGPLVVVYKP